MKIFRFICNWRGKHSLGDFPIDYMPQLYSVWKCKICGIKNVRTIVERTKKDPDSRLGFRIESKVVETWE